jgi:phosphoglycolate phosphatase
VGYTTVLFDLDGTLTDSQQGIVSSYQHALAAFEIDVDETSVKPWIGPPLRDGFATLGVPAGQIPAATDRYRAHFAEIGIHQNRLYDGVPEMLADLGQAGVTLGLATSKLVDFAEQILAQFAIAEHFEVVAGAARDGSRITKADIVAFALESLGRPQLGSAALVGDRGDDMRAAVHHGLFPVGVSWGYGDNEELQASGSQMIIDHPSALTAILAG